MPHTPCTVPSLEVNPSSKHITRTLRPERQRWKRDGSLVATPAAALLPYDRQPQGEDCHVLGAGLAQGLRARQEEVCRLRGDPIRRASDRAAPLPAANEDDIP